MATVSGFLTVAGAALTTVGAIAKNEDVMKVGGFMSLAGGIGSAFNSATETAAQNSSDAFFQAEAATQSNVPLTAGVEAASGTAAAQEAANAAAWQGGWQADAATGGLSSELAPQAINDFGYDNISEGLYKSAFDKAGSAAAAEAQPATALKDLQDWRSPLEQPTTPQGPLSGAGLDQNRLQSLLKGSAEKAGSRAASSQSPYSLVQPSANPSLLETASRDYAGGAVKSPLEDFFADVKAGAKGLGKFVKNNKELVDIGGGVLKSIYGPEAERMNYAQSIMQRQLRNLNSPIRLANLGPR